MSPVCKEPRGYSQKCSFSYARGADNGDKSRGGVIGQAVDERNVEALLFDLGYVALVPGPLNMRQGGAKAYIVGARRLFRELAGVGKGEGFWILA